MAVQCRVCSAVHPCVRSASSLRDVLQLASCCRRQQSSAASTAVWTGGNKDQQTPATMTRMLQTLFTFKQSLVGTLSSTQLTVPGGWCRLSSADSSRQLRCEVVCPRASARGERSTQGPVASSRLLSLNVMRRSGACWYRLMLHGLVSAAGGVSFVGPRRVQYCGRCALNAKCKFCDDVECQRSIRRARVADDARMRLTFAD